MFARPLTPPKPPERQLQQHLNGEERRSRAIPIAAQPAAAKKEEEEKKSFFYRFWSFKNFLTRIILRNIEVKRRETKKFFQPVRDQFFFLLFL